MSYFDDASLVMIPSGYKTSKVYSVKPTDGSGDLTFSRSNDTASRIAPNGLIEKVRTNICLQSEGFNTASWSAANTTITANAGVAPNGTTTADKIVPTTTGTSRWVEQSRSITSSIPYTNSFYVKADGFSWVNVFHIDGDLGAYFNVSNGTIGTVSSGVSASIVSVGSGWYRCIVTKTSGGSTGYTVVQLVDADGSTTATASGTNGVLVWGAQIEAGDIATDYIATTSAAVSVGPVANVPRLDYLNSSCPRLLLEPQRTNLALYSEAFGTASYWYANNATITSNSVVSPDGYTNADTYTAAGANNYLNGSATSAGSNTVTFSVFVKAGTVSQFRLRESYYYGTSTVFNIANGTVIAGTGTITSYGNGWYRCTHTQTYGAGEVNLSWTYDLNTAASGTAYIYGAMAEVGAYATSYIPTLGASVTRGADACSKTGISSLIGQTEGTVFVDWQIDSMPSVGSYFTFLLTQSIGTFSDIMYVAAYADGRVQAAVFVGNVLQCNLISSTGFISTGANKFAFGYKANDFVLYANGTQVATDTSGSVPAATSIDLADTSGGKMNYKQAILFKTRLSNADLAALTA